MLTTSKTKKTKTKTKEQDKYQGIPSNQKESYDKFLLAMGLKG